MDDPEKIRRLKQLTETVLPALARQHRWPIRLDHCFKRICFDHAFAAPWFEHLPRPAERHLAGPPLHRALQCAEQLASDTAAGDLLRERNQASLRWRGKLREP